MGEPYQLDTDSNLPKIEMPRRLGEENNPGPNGLLQVARYLLQEKLPLPHLGFSPVKKGG